MLAEQSEQDPSPGRWSRDPLSGAGLGDPVAAVRLGVSTALALTVAVLVMLILRTLRRDDVSWAWASWEGLRSVLAGKLTLGATLTVVTWRDRPGRRLGLRALETSALVVLVLVMEESWSLVRSSQGLDLAVLWEELRASEVFVPQTLGRSVALLLAARARGRPWVGAAFAVPQAAGFMSAFWWILDVPWYLVLVGLESLLLPLAERALRRLAIAVLDRPAD